MPMSQLQSWYYEPRKVSYRYDFDGASQTCPICHDLTRTVSNFVEDHQNGASARCSSCAFILKAIKHFRLTTGLGGRSSDALPGEKDYYVREEDIAVHLVRQDPIEDNGIPGRLIFFLGGRDSKRSEYVQLVTRQNERFVYGKESMTKTPTTLKQDVPQHSSDDACLARVTQWVNECHSMHPRCRDSASLDGEDAPLPSRLLDLRNNEIKLIDTLGQTGIYLTLSHCWGSLDDRFRTFKSNLADRKHGVTFTDLPKTFRDAITLTRRLKIHYLWIDALCIIQDDMDDWTFQSGKMSRIFANSWLTLCASHARDGTIGLFHDRYRVDVPPGKGYDYWEPLCDTIFIQKLSLPKRAHLISARVVAKHYFQGLVSSPPLIHGAHLPVWTPPNLSAEPLLARAWAFQERLLARRTLDFHMHELVWECREMRRCECREADRRGFFSERRTFLDSIHGLPPETPRRHSTSSNDGLEVPNKSITIQKNAWYRLVEIYTTMNLTFESDRLPALSGLAQAMAPIKGFKYNAGLWEQDLPQCLLWMTGSMGSLSPPNKTASSWSWISLGGPVVFHHYNQLTKIMRTSQWHKIHSPVIGSDPFGRCAKGRLVITGPIVRGKLQYKRNLGFTTTTASVTSKGIDVSVQLDRDYSVQGSGFHISPETELWLLELVRESDYRHSKGRSLGLVLLANEVEDEGTLTFERLGMFKREIKLLQTSTTGFRELNDIYAKDDMKTVAIV